MCEASQAFHPDGIGKLKPAFAGIEDLHVQLTN
jgi:hypothetical protein